MNRVFYLIIFTLVFTVFIFFLKNTIFIYDTREYDEINYIEKSSDLEKILNDENLFNLKDKNKEDPDNFNSAFKLDFQYFPKTYEKQVIDFKNIINAITWYNQFMLKISWLTVEFYEDIIDVRWKMKDAKIMLFWVHKLQSSEFSSLFIHELAHYIDLYFFIKKVSFDPSNNFYDISWDATKVMKKWQNLEDFVSWYAMTNKYEDLAESFTYYVLHNRDFMTKARKSIILNKKYEFFEKYLFKNEEFRWSDFSIDENILDYYRDITKIDINDEKFLQYLQK